MKLQNSSNIILNILIISIELMDLIELIELQRKICKKINYNKIDGVVYFICPIIAYKKLLLKEYYNIYADPEETKIYKEVQHFMEKFKNK